MTMPCAALVRLRVDRVFQDIKNPANAGFYAFNKPRAFGYLPYC